MQIYNFLNLICFITYLSLSMNCNSMVKKPMPSVNDSCNKTRDSIPKRKPVDFMGAKLRDTPVGNYNSIKYDIQLKKASFTLKYSNTADLVQKKAIIDSAGNYILEAVVNRLIPHWYKMKWDITGYSEVPQTGIVGCSYFVSNVLKHAGFLINRYKVAQSYPWGIAKTFQLNDSIDYLENYAIDSLNVFINQHLTDGLYILGLNFHVGFLLIRNKYQFFIHSSFTGPKEVVIENLADSEAVKTSTVHVIGEITSNDKLIEKWIKNEEIKTVNE